MSGENCSSSCYTRDHESWGECVRAKGLRIAYCASAKGMDLTRQKKWDAELALYKQARDEGIQPRGTKESDTRAAMDISDTIGRPFDAEKPLKGTHMDFGKGEVVTF